MELLKQLCSIHAPSGNEGAMKDFILDYVAKHQANWKVQPLVLHGDDFQDSVVLVFGNPRTAVYAHIDSIGFTVKYNRELVKIGGPQLIHNTLLRGKDEEGDILCELTVSGGDQKKAHYSFERELKPGTELVFDCDFRQSDRSVQSCYLDNRLGCYVALQLAEDLNDGAICFSTYEEHGGGSVQFLAKYLYETYRLKQALVCDITWATDGVKQGKGVAISLRDSRIPRKKYTDRILKLAESAGIAYQLEVEDAGGSDGTELQRAAYPIDWCFIGAAESNVHTPDEKVHKNDITSMIALYKYLMPRL